MKKFLTSFNNPVLFKGYPFALYVLIDHVVWADSLSLVTTHNTTSYLTSMFDNKGIYELTVQDTAIDFDAYFRAVLSGENTQLVETLNCFARSKCDGVYLRWENDLAGYDYWLYSGNERDRIRSGTRESFEPFIEDGEDETGNFEILKKRFEKTIRVYTDFPKQNAEGFNQLARSRFVEMYLDDKWWKVDIDMNSLTVSKFQPYGKCSLDIILPKIYVK